MEEGSPCQLQSPRIGSPMLQEQLVSPCNSEARHETGLGLDSPIETLNFSPKTCSICNESGNSRTVDLGASVGEGFLPLEGLLSARASSKRRMVCGWLQSSLLGIACMGFAAEGASLKESVQRT